MTQQQQIADAVAPVVREWLDRCPGQPLVLRSRGDSVEASIGLGDDGRRITGQQAAQIIGVSYRTFQRADFFGILRGDDNRFSRLAVERCRDRRRG